MSWELLDAWLELAVRVVGVGCIGFGAAWLLINGANWLYDFTVEGRTAMGHDDESRLQRVLRWFRIVDEQGNLSLTNVTVFGSLLNLYLGPGVGDSLVQALLELGPLAMALFGYGHKRAVVARAAAQQAMTAEQFAHLTAALDTLERSRRAGGGAVQSA